jgi:hypothetical protein
MACYSVSLLNADCPRHDARIQDCCDMVCPDLPSRDIEGKLDVLRVECTRCDRKGRYSVAKLIEKHVL